MRKYNVYISNKLVSKDLSLQELKNFLKDNERVYLVSAVCEV